VKSIRVRIQLEPILEQLGEGKTPEDCERLALVHSRFARQYRVKAAMLRLDAGQVPRWIRFGRRWRLIWLPAKGHQAE